MAFSRKNAWEAAPRWMRWSLGPLFGTTPPALWLGRRFRKTRAFLRSAQWWGHSETREYQARQLRRICKLAYEHTPYYRDRFESCAFNPDEICDPEDLQVLPLIDKEVIRRHATDMCTVPVGSWKVDSVSTGGSGGEPLKFYIGAGRSSVEYAYLVESWARQGYQMRTPRAVFRGRVVQPSRSGMRLDYDPILREYRYSNFHMCDEAIEQYLEHISGIGPCYLHVYPSSVAALARFIRRTKVRPPTNICGIIAESENIYREQREWVESTFGCRYSSCYGHSEKLVLAAECEHSSDYHVWPTYGYFELVDSHGHPVTTPGQRGEIVGTGFINTVMPFIRYRTGDYATFVADQCSSCGRNQTIIREVRGHNTQEYMVLSDGTQVPWAALNMHDDTFDHVRQFQFFQLTPGHATLRVVPAGTFGHEDMTRIRRRLNRKLEGRLVFEFEVVDEIELTHLGKSIFVEQRIRNPLLGVK